MFVLLAIYSCIISIFVYTYLHNCQVKTSILLNSCRGKHEKKKCCFHYDIEVFAKSVLSDLSVDNTSSSDSVSNIVINVPSRNLYSFYNHVFIFILPFLCFCVYILFSVLKHHTNISLQNSASVE